MKIEDLYDCEVQGSVMIKKITEDDVVQVCFGMYGLPLNAEPYLDKEITYMYAEDNVLVIEYREED